MEASLLQEFLIHILSPIYRITEDDTVRDERMGKHLQFYSWITLFTCHADELKMTAVELQDLVQQKVGTTKFAITYNKIRQTVLGVQRERRTARITKVTIKVYRVARCLTFRFCSLLPIPRLQRSASSSVSLRRRKVGNGKTRCLRRCLAFELARCLRCSS